MRISDWSSDVCSSDPKARRPGRPEAQQAPEEVQRQAQKQTAGEQGNAKTGAQPAGQRRLRASHAAEMDSERRYAVSRRSLNSFGRAPRRKVPSGDLPDERSEEHTSELQSLMRNSYAVFCLKKKKKNDIQ